MLYKHTCCKFEKGIEKYINVEGCYKPHEGLWFVLGVVVRGLPFNPPTSCVSPYVLMKGDHGVPLMKGFATHVLFQRNVNN